MNKLILTPLALVALLQVSCSSSTQETDGRKYHSNSSPLQGKMGVHFKRVRTTTTEPMSAENAPAAPQAPGDGLLDGVFGNATENDPPGLLDRNEKPEEPGAEYWMHGQQSPSPLQGKMGVRVSRRKK